MTTAYILQSQQNTNFCVGVTSVAAGSNVALLTLSGAGGTTSQWSMDPNTGYIQLIADPSLYLDVQGTGANPWQLIVSNFVIGRVSQKWNWVGNPPFISNQAYPTMVIDNSGGNVTAGNPILLWSLNNGQNQKWSKLAVPAAIGSVSALSGRPRLTPFAG